jgi:hypothetical protein
MMLITKYIHRFQITPFPVPLCGKLSMMLLPLWGKVGKGVINIYLIIVLCMIANTQII